jgi:hypothetical protein
VAHLKMSKRGLKLST